MINDFLRKYCCLVLLALLVASFFLGKCSTKKERSQQTDSLIAARDSVHQSFIVIDGLKHNVATRDAIILTKDEAIKVGLLEQERLKKLHLKEIIANADLQGIIKRQDSIINLPPKTEYITIKDSSGNVKNYVKYPIKIIDVHDRFLSLDAGLDSIGKAWYKNIVPFSGQITIGYQKAGFLRTKPVGIYTSENPHLTVNQMDITIIEEGKKWHSLWWVHAVGGIVAFEGLRYLLR